MAKKNKPPGKGKIQSAKEKHPRAKDVNSIDTAAPPETDTIIAPEKNFPIVGIGASAGGLSAFEAFFSGMPADRDPGMSFVLVQHLAPDHKSILTDLVKRYTRMQVYEVEDGMDVLINCTYIIPPNRDMAFLNGRLQLLEPATPRGMRLPIDFFFRSLAQDQRERAICIVLSGTGSDGTLGVRAIKGEGGMVMVQNTESTEYDGMPRSAIATGLVDFVLPPAEMPDQLIEYAAHAFGKTSHTISIPPRSEENALKKIMILLRAQTGHDLSLYKQNTIMRRVERRMAVNQIDMISEYIGHLRKNTEEVDALFRDMLIGVTSFFRDQEAFAILYEHIIPRLFAGKPGGTAVRIWTAGCSTGEEAYSIAILIQEYLESMKRNLPVQVFATDIDSRAIEIARAGVYPASIAADISSERLTRFFAMDQESGTYRIQKNIRDMIVFSEQDITKDPPFSKIDLISCRNLLIYMSGELQKKLIPLFHYALNPEGVLFLGNSETVGEFIDLFYPIDRKWKMYQCKEGARDAIRTTPGTILPPLTDEGAVPRQYGKNRNEAKVPVRELAERELLCQYAPAAVVVNGRGDIVFIYGRTGNYLEPAPGDADMNVVRMAREGLRRELTSALHKVTALKEPVCNKNLRVQTNGNSITVNLTVRPMPMDPEAGVNAELYMVIFEDAPSADPAPPLPPITEGGEATECDARIAALERELRTKEEYLQTTLEEMETSNEELKSTNEELQSVNEELQSTNEELETSKEELQSVNEELATVNAELQQKVIDLSRSNNDMNNLLAGTGVGTVFVDHQLRIQRFTPSVSSIINLIKTDLGRPLGHLVANIVGYDRLVEDVKAVLDSLIPIEIEVQTVAGSWYMLRILPYRTLDNVIEGAVITFIDITEIKKAREIFMEVETIRRLAMVVRDASDAIIVQNFDGCILAWNPEAERMYGWSEAEALAMNVHNLIPKELLEETLGTVRRLGRSEFIEPYRTKRIARNGRIMEVWITTTVLIDEAGEPYAITTTEKPAVSEKSGAGAL
ncbi:MAG: PAS domain-containing protein [Spirochaetes bacterium]|nr:PAS domain-containing protein [Spirochaetota bacterium]